MNNRYKYYKCLFLFLLFVFNNCTTVSKDLTELMGKDPPKDITDKGQELFEKAQGLEKEEKLKQLRVGIIPFDYTVETGQGKAHEALQALAIHMVERKTFKPFSLRNWLHEDVNKTTAKNIFEIMDRARATEISIDFICHGRIFKAGHEYGLMVSVFPLNPELEPTYYIRNFTNYGNLYDATDEIVAEMEKRSNRKLKSKFQKRLFIKRFNKNYYTYTNLDGGEGSIIKIPYLNVDGTSFKTDDNFFSDILLYNLHTTRLFHVGNSNINNYIISNPKIPKGMDYVLDIDLDISTTVSMMTVRIIDQRQKKLVFKYKYPFKHLSMENLTHVMRENSKIIIMHLLTDEEKKQVGVVNLEAIGTQQLVFCEDYYLGYGRQFNLVFPSGAAELTISNTRYDIYISPFSLNNKIYDHKDSFLLDLQK